MKTRLLTAAAFALAACTAAPVLAEELNLNEKPDTVRVSLAPYSIGLGGGAISALNNGLITANLSLAKVIDQSGLTADQNLKTNSLLMKS